MLQRLMQCTSLNCEVCGGEGALLQKLSHTVSAGCRWVTLMELWLTWNTLWTLTLQTWTFVLPVV